MLHALRAQLPVLVFLWSWATVFLGGTAAAISESLGTRATLTGCGLALAVLLPLGASWIDRRAYERARFVFRTTRLEVHEGVGRRRERHVPLQELVHAELERTPDQRRRGLASLVLTTHSIDPRHGHRLRLDDIEHPDEALRKIEALLRVPDEPERLPRAA